MSPTQSNTFTINENGIFFTTLEAHIWVTLSNVFTHFTKKGQKGWFLIHIFEVRIKLDKMFKD